MKKSALLINAILIVRTYNNPLLPPIGEPDDFVEEDLPEPVVPPQNSRLPLQDTQITPPSKPDTTDTSYRQNKRNTSVSSDPGNNKKSGGQNKTIETNKPLRIQDISKETENRVILSKSSQKYGTASLDSAPQERAE